MLKYLNDHYALKVGGYATSSIFILYLNHILISGTLYALDVYHIEIDTSLLRYYFWMTIVIIMLLVGVIAWLLTISINALIIALI